MHKKAETMKLHSQKSNQGLVNVVICYKYCPSRNDSNSFEYMMSDVWVFSYFFPLYERSIMSTWNIIMLTCDLFMLTQNIIMLTCSIHVITSTCEVIMFTSELNYLANIHIHVNKSFINILCLHVDIPVIYLVYLTCILMQYSPRRWRSGLERSPRKRKIACSYPSRDWPKSW